MPRRIFNRPARGEKSGEDKLAHGALERMQNLPTVPKLPVWSVATIFAISILVTFTFWWIIPARFQVNEGGDYAYYQDVARNILAGRGVRSSDGDPAIATPPGQPLFLAGAFGLSKLLRVPEGITLSVLILLCMGLNAVFIFLVARSVWGTSRGYISALIWITYPFALWLTKQPNSEIVFLVFFYGGFCLFWHALSGKSRAWHTYLICGLIMGCAMLIRPIALAGGILLCVIFWFTAHEMAARLRLFLITMILLGNFAAVLPWEAWVYAETGRVVILGTHGKNSLRDGLAFGTSMKSYRRGIYLPQGVRDLMNEAAGSYEELLSFSGVATFMSKQLRERPLAVAELLAIKAARSWYGTETQRFEFWILLIQLAYITLAVWGSVIAWKRGVIAKQLCLSVLLFAFYFWLMTIMALPILRYMVPAVGLMFALTPGILSRRKSLAVGVMESPLQSLGASESRGADLLSAKQISKVSIIIPVYNEQATIAEVVDRVCAVKLNGLAKEIIITDDGSRDDSPSVIVGIQQQRSEIVKVHTSLINLGKGAAIRFGFEFATGDLILIQDADLELNPEEYPVLIAPIIRGETNVVYGSRFRGRSDNIPMRTLLANRFFAALTNMLYGSQLTDMATAYKVFRSDVIKGLNLRSARYEFEPEVTAKLLLAGQKIIEVPISYNPRSVDAGKKIGWIDGVEYIYTLLKYRFFVN